VAWSALNALAVHMGSLADRRKALLVVTEGIGQVERRRGQEFLPTLDTVIRSANRANVAVYPFDPGGNDDAGREGLRRLAEETDGASIDGDPAAGLKRAAADSNLYYLLSFSGTHPDDGLFRAL